MKIKNLLQGSLFLSLCCCALVYLLNSNQGLRTYRTLKREFNQEQERVEKLEYKIKEIKQNIEQWQTDSFEREKIARQDLSMSFTNELVYLIPAK